MSKIDISSAPAVTDAATAEAFVRWCCRIIGGGFHPDTPFSDYQEVDGSPTFDPADEVTLQAHMDAAFGLLDDPSAVALDEVVSKNIRELVCVGEWGWLVEHYPGSKVVADAGVDPLEAAALLALVDAKRADRRAWLVRKSDETAWEDAGSPEGGQFSLTSTHATPGEAARRLAWLLDGQVVFDDNENEHNALFVLCGGQDPVAWLATMAPGTREVIDATGGEVEIYAL